MSAATLSSIVLDSDPEAQAVVTDFLDYTEYLRSDVKRSLNLIHDLDDKYTSQKYAVHDLTTILSTPATAAAAPRLDLVTLRKQLSHHLDQAINAREASHAEAGRLYDVVDRHYSRLSSIVTKLKALPRPPSRDPTPVPQPRSPETKRSRSGRTIKDGTSTQRLTLHPPRAVGPLDNRARNRRVTVPGEVLPPYNPDSPIASPEQSDWDSEPPSPMPIATSRIGKVDKSLKLPKIKKIKVPKLPRTPREPGQGTNVHSMKAGISTSNALAKLSPPPPDAQLGSSHLPWMRLTEYEMAKLRKKMKKNAIWEPSSTMVRRELAERNRGWENYKKAKELAEAEGSELIDCDNVAENRALGKPLRKGEVSAGNLALEETTLSNRGMKLNEAKKLKRENIAREQAALAALEAEQAAKRLGDIGNSFKSLFSTLHNTTASPIAGTISTPTANRTPTAGKTKITSSRKRKLDESNATESPAPGQDNVKAEEVKPSPKKRKVVKPPAISTPETPLDGKTTTTAVPLAGVGVSKAVTTTQSSQSTPLTSPISPDRPSAGLRSSTAPKAGPTPTPPASRSASRRQSAAPERPATREGLRRLSTPANSKTPALETTAKAAQTAASRRSKRPAPGAITQTSQDGGAVVSVGKRKAKPGPKPKKLAVQKGAPADSYVEQRIDADGVLEEIDPNEPRYCVCGDVSYGEMICCENNAVSRPSVAKSL